ncbi:MAG: hypothetical protein ACYS0K_06370 [Planctomycetota bacterium]|jgi:hypothetical protein
MEAASNSGLAWWVRRLVIFVPKDIRREFVGNLQADCHEMREAGASRLKVSLSMARALLEGFAQHAPLEPAVTGSSDKPVWAAWSTGVGRISWRLLGPGLFLGYVLGSVPVLLSAVGLLVLSFACLVTLAVTGKNPLPEAQSRFMATILGGTVATLLTLFAFAIPTVVLIGLASLFSVTLVSALAIKAYVFVATATACGITGSGWVPQEWTPKRLVENEDIYHHEVEGERAEAPAEETVASGT